MKNPPSQTWSAENPLDVLQRPPRLTRHSLPPYSYVPRMHPHPFSDPSGHRFGMEYDAIDPRDDLAIENVNDWAIDLFNRGYYWESHEAWESLWHAFERSGPQADFVKGLIKLAAAGVKAREGRVAGVQRHALRALELFRASADAHSGRRDLCMGLSNAWLGAQCRSVSDQPESFIETSHCEVVRVFPFTLVPTRSGS